MGKKRVPVAEEHKKYDGLVLTNVDPTDDVEHVIDGSNPVFVDGVLYGFKAVGVPHSLHSVESIDLMLTGVKNPYWEIKSS